jgi:hypothetical protein
MVDAKALRENKFEVIEENARQFLAAIAKARSEMAN